MRPELVKRYFVIEAIMPEDLERIRSDARELERIGLLPKGVSSATGKP
jgi:hypothetical protein